MVTNAGPKRAHDQAPKPRHEAAAAPGNAQKSNERAADLVVKNMASASFAQGPFLEQLAATLSEPTVESHDWTEDDISRPHGRVLTTAEAIALAARISASHLVPAHYTKNGCESRAHIICDELHKEGIACAKVFADSQGDGRGASFLMRGETMTSDWTYHVAPIVYVRDVSGQVSIRVIDPSMSNAPLEVAAWISIFRNSAQVSVDLTDDAQFGLRSGGSKHESFDQHLGGARATVAGEKQSLETFYLDDQRASPALGPVSKVIASGLEKALQSNSLVEKRYQPLLESPRVTEVMNKTPDSTKQYVNKTTITFAMPTAEIANAIAHFGPDSSEDENRLTDNAAIEMPAGVSLLTLDGRAFKNQLIFEAHWAVDATK